MNEKIQNILTEIESVIVGKNENVEKILMAILAQGHVLMEDVPGVGKTTTALTFAKVLGLDTRRVQFTSDTVPSDVIGYSVYDKSADSFVYKPGAIMTNLLLADEINRTSSKTQSALLEAMEEHRVTVDGNTYDLPTPFVVLATQNPTGSAGTTLLPSSQLDRFLIRLSIGYPDHRSQINILRDRHSENPLDRAIQRVFAVAVAQNVDLAAVIGVANAEADEETVKLRTRKQRCASRASRVLGREDDEGRREVVGVAIHGDAVFLHRFQKGGLRFAGGTVDLVREEEVGHDRAGLVDEGIGRFIVHRVADDVRGDGVRRELDAAGVEAQNLREGQGGGRFADARHVLHEDVALCEDRHEDFLDVLVFADDDGFDLRQNVLDFLIHLYVLLLGRWEFQVRWVLWDQQAQLDRSAAGCNRRRSTSRFPRAYHGVPCRGSASSRSRPTDGWFRPAALL